MIAVLITDDQVNWLRKYGSRGVCLDDTFNSTKYPLKLATVLVVDDYDRGLPAGKESDLGNTFVRRKKYTGGGS